MAVALYARVSTSRQADNELSIPDQLRQLNEWCEANSRTIVMEYIEPGASARDDKRPVFQQMIADAMLRPAPFDTILVHSLSRFFRDSLEFALYERKLKKVGIKIISITQQTADDSAGEMARKMFSLFDEYQSKENSKHTLRAMKENARQGYFNGSRPPFGYRAEPTDEVGVRGRKKKRLVIDDGEAEMVRLIYQLYLNGHHGQPMGMKSVASHLNEQGYSLRNRPWRAQKIYDILSDETYIGNYYFNRTDQNRKPKPKSEWVLTNVEPIIEVEDFQRVMKRRQSRTPEKISPSQLASPIFLSGLLKCGQCGAGMTLMTGKSGRYRYYKCSTQKHMSKDLCDTPNIPMDQLDNQVREQLAERVFTAERVRNMLKSLKKDLKARSESEKTVIRSLERKLKDAEAALERLYRGVEDGVLELDDTLKARVQKLKAQREELLIQLSGTRRRGMLPIDKITAKQVDAFCGVLKTRFMDAESGFGKGYLRYLVDEIVIEPGKAVITGSHEALAELVTVLNPENPAISVPAPISKWPAQRDSNSRHPGSKPGALSS